MPASGTSWPLNNRIKNAAMKIKQPKDRLIWKCRSGGHQAFVVVVLL